ncbi:dTMP kinase [Anaeromyxobacter terrae]|uniref:dTMP kinase n=1 Tax=Anaeromyxobacter terrae TaxID=2925406 RepID=UPI001F58CF8E|nr:dTMP kinase [Anaeromyxobacter sp. SG22]
MFVSFEGIDGSGKTTLSNLVCERLRAAGHPVLHAREKGVLASGVARRVRELTRDARLLEMSARTELFLNLARETQQLDEIVRPALADGRVVIADRSLHSLVALAAAGRGLPRDEVEAAVRVGAGGTWPDLIVLVDVDPDLARLRKRVGKILEGRDGDAESRKGLAGAGLQVRIRRHLRAEAERDPARWIVTSNEGRPLAALADEVAGAILSRVAPRTAFVPPARRGPGSARASAVEAEASPEQVAVRFRAAVAALAAAEPHLAAFLLAGIPGAAEHALRVSLAPRAPRLVARSLHGLADPGAFALRRALAGEAPADVLESLGDEPSAEAMSLRELLLDAAPEAALAGLARNDSPEAWELRARGLERGAIAGVLDGLAGVDDPDAWALRGEGLRRELLVPVARSLAGLAGPRADALRVALADRDRLAALRSTAGVDGPVARELRERLFEHAAKRVLRSLTGIDAPYAWALRERALPATKEALDSVDGMDHPRAWALREAGVELWPTTAVSSLRELALRERGRELVARALRTAPGSLPVLRNAHAAFSGAALALTAPGAALARQEEEACSI